MILSGKRCTKIANMHARIGLRKEGKQLTEGNINGEVHMIRSKELDNIHVTVEDVINALENGEEVRGSEITIRDAA